jgi:hypothetical protein
LIEVRRFVYSCRNPEQGVVSRDRQAVSRKVGIGVDPDAWKKP